MIRDDIEITVVEETRGHAYIVLEPWKFWPKFWPKHAYILVELSRLSREPLEARSGGQTESKASVSQDTDQ